MISLDDQTRSYLERKFAVVAESDFIGKRVQKMLQADREYMEEKDACAHEEAPYHGNRIACVKCGDVKHESWTRDTLITEVERES